jgi:V8-like Glu-specific endopeptidase
MSTENEEELSDEEIRAYWTPERMAAAKPMVWTPTTTPKRDAEPVQPTGEPEVIPGYDPTQSAQASKVGSPLVATVVADPTQLPYRAVGKLYFTSGQTNYSASACVIGPNTLLTAAHSLLYRTPVPPPPPNRVAGIPSRGYIFIPALLANGFAPYGT